MSAHSNCAENLCARARATERKKSPAEAGLVEMGSISRAETVNPWSRPAVGICRPDTCRPDICQSEPCRTEPAPEAAAPYAADRRRQQRAAWPRTEPSRLEFSA